MHLSCRLVSKEQEIQGLQAELEARTKELSENMEQIHQQVRNDPDRMSRLHFGMCNVREAK